MDWQEQAVILAAEIIAGFVFGRIFIPYFRKIKTGKFDMYIGDRFAQDGSEPKFGGIVIMLTVGLGLCIGLFYENSKADVYLSAYFDKRLLLVSVVFLIMLTGIGISEDYVKETKCSIGMKPLYKFTMEFLLCLCFLVMLKFFGFEVRQVLLPFRLGYINLGAAYYPLTALYMILMINLVKLHDCLNGVTEYGTDGLCAVTIMLFSLALSSGAAFSSKMGMAALFAVCTAAGASAYLFWGISPSKLYLGESGALLLGGLVSVSVVFSRLPLLFVMMGLGIVADGICAGLQRLIFKKSKKLLFKGNTLHEHLKNKGFGDYKIIAVFSLITLLGCAGGIAFVIYSGKFLVSTV